MLIGNYSVLAKHPGRNIGGGAIGLGLNRGDRNKSSMNRGAFTSLTRRSGALSPARDIFTQ